VYSRCVRGLRLDFPTPQILRAGRYGCDLYSYSFATRREAPVAAANSRADEYWPSVWRGRIAFVRAYRSRRDPDRTATPYLYLRALGDRGGGSRRLRRPSSVITVRVSTRSGRRIERRRLSTMIEGLDLRGRTLAYAWKRIDDFDTVSFIYLAAAGGGLRPAARGATSGGGAADRVRTIGSPSLNLDRVDWLFQNAGAPEYFGAFARRLTVEPLSPGAGVPMASQPTKAVAFAAADAAVYFIDGGLGATFDPVSQPAAPSR